MAEDELTKREFLTAAAVLGGGAAVGYAARDATRPEQAMLGGGGEMPVEDLEQINLVLFKADEDPADYEPDHAETWAVHPDHGILYWEDTS